MDRITRRRLIQGSAALASSATTLAAAQPFMSSTVRSAAQDLAKQPFRAPDTKLPEAAASMTYDQYRGIRFKQDRALWRGQDLLIAPGLPEACWLECYAAAGMSSSMA